MDTEDQVAAHICYFGCVQKGNYLEERMGKVKSGKAAGRDKVTGEMIKGWGELVITWISKLCNVAFERGIMPEVWRFVETVLLYKGQRRRTYCKNYRSVSLLNMVEKKKK